MHTVKFRKYRKVERRENYLLEKQWDCFVAFLSDLFSPRTFSKSSFILHESFASCFLSPTTSIVFPCVIKNPE